MSLEKEVARVADALEDAVSILKSTVEAFDFSVGVTVVTDSDTDNSCAATKADSKKKAASKKKAPAKKKAGRKKTKPAADEGPTVDDLRETLIAYLDTDGASKAAAMKIFEGFDAESVSTVPVENYQEVIAALDAAREEL